MKQIKFFPRLLVCFLISLLFTTVSAQKSTFNATFRGLENGIRIVVSEPQGGRLVPVDTLTPDKKGRISLSRYSYTPVMLGLTLFQPNSPMLHVILQPKEDVVLEVDFMPALNLFNITSVKGSDNMVLYKKYTNLMLELVQNEQTHLLDNRMESLLDDNPGVLMSAFLVTYFEQSFEQHVALYKKIRDALISQWPNDDFVKHLDSRLASAILPGMDAPDIELADPDGNLRRLSDLRGKVVLIDFWASWCRPCRMENPNVVRLYNQFHNRGFEIFSVSLDKDRNAWLTAIQKDNLSWPNHVSDLRGWSSAGGRLYGISSIPSTVLVGPDGKILARNLRGRELENKLNEIFGE